MWVHHWVSAKLWARTTKLDENNISQSNIIVVAAHNPGSIVRLFKKGFLKPDPCGTKYPPSVVIIPNADLSVAFHQTPLQDWYKSEKWRINTRDIKSEMSEARFISNAFRLAYLFHYGGVYMDTDAISLKPVGYLSTINFICRQPPQLANIKYNHAFSSFDKNHPFLKVSWSNSSYSKRFESSFIGSNG